MFYQFLRIAQPLSEISCVVTDYELSTPEENHEQLVPSWSAFNSLCSEEDLQQKQVGSLPVIPNPVNQHATVYTALLNFNSILDQLGQNYLPVAL